MQAQIPPNFSDMPPGVLEAIRESIRAEIASRSLYGFVMYTMPDYKMGWVHEVICRELDMFLEGIARRESPRLMLTVPPRHGKQLAHGTPIFTPNGWVNHGDLRPGDKLYGIHGQEITVVAIGDESKSTRVVRFTNGDEITCHSNHEWPLIEGRSKKYSVFETCEIGNLWSGTKGSRGSRALYHVPLVGPIVGREAELPSDPYAFGIWLGEGSEEKKIPVEYLTAPIGQRLELLAGIIDSDGSVDRDKRVRISTTSIDICTGVQCLLSGLGIRYSLYEQEPKMSSSGIQGRKKVYQISFSPHIDVPTRLPIKKVFPGKRRMVAIESIRMNENETMGRCIQVSAEDGIYLAGKTFIPTHNSELASRRFPAYALGRYPDMSIISTSYSADLSSRMNRDVQRIIEDDRYGTLFSGTKLYGKNIRTVSSGAYLRNSDIFEVVGRKGVYKSAGVGGGITGMGGDCLIIDDPFKNRAEADSPTIRENIWDWYTSSFYTRKSPGGGILLINTRWHTDDLSGRLLAMENGDKWRVVNFKAIATEDEEHRKAGEPLHPERYDLGELLSIKATIGSRDWSALYQQEPVPDGGSIFKDEWIQYHNYTRSFMPRFDSIVSSWDMAFKDGKDTDFVVGQIWAKKGADVYLLDQVRARMDFSATLNAFRRLCQKWPEASAKYVEDKANGPAVINTLCKEIPGIVPINPEGGKEARAHAVTPYWEAGNVYLPNPNNAPWIVDYITELLTFPSSAHDDQVDATTQAQNKLLGGLSIVKAFAAAYGE